MQWEKIQEEKRREVDKSDVDAKKRQQESERRKRKEQQEKMQEEKQKQKQEIRELQDRRKSLAESWEKKNTNNNNKETVMTHKSTEVKVSPTKGAANKDATKAKSPRKLQSKQVGNRDSIIS